jgi:adenylate cyclase
MSISAEQRRLAAIMFTDMVGYTALAQRNEALALELLEEHRRILRSIFPRFNGTEIKTIGDAFLVEFQSALEAAQCALEIQRTLAKRNHDVSREHRVELRIGIHVGDVVHREGDVYGDGVNIASRIEPVAGIGGICISVDVERQIHNALEARFEKLAPIELKNVQVPMDLFRIVLPWEHRSDVRGQKSEIRKSSAVPKRNAALVGAFLLLLIIGIGWWWTTLPHKKLASTAAEGSQPQNIPAKSIAVLPFENRSEDKANAYFADGIQDEILTRLSKIADLKVISRTSTQHYKSAPENLPDIARQLGVAHILEGSVQKASDQVRVNVQLINALTDAHLWADTYDRKLTDIFAVESEISKAIAETLQAKLSGSEKSLISKTPTVNPEAYELYLKGRFFWNKRTGADLLKSIEYFKQAVEKDQKYALAYAGLADAYVLLPPYGAASPSESFPQAEAAARKALELDDTLAEAHTSLGQFLLFYDLDFAGSTREFERALALDPNYATAHHWYGGGPPLALGQFDRAITEGKRAVELDPLSLINNADLGWLYFNARRYNEAEARARKTLEIDSHFYLAHYYLGEVLQFKGQLTEAIAEYKKAAELDDDPFVLGLLAQAYAKLGQGDEALKMLGQLQQLATRRYVTSYSFALVHIALGEKDKAIEWLERSYRDRAGPDIALIKVDPFLDDLRGDPRFEALVQRVVAPK